MGNERIDEDPIQMQPVLSMKPKDVEDEASHRFPGRIDGGPVTPATDGTIDGGSRPRD